MLLIGASVVNLAGFAAYVAAGSVALVVVNSLFAPPAPKDAAPWAVELIRRMLSVGRYLRFATVAIWVCVIFVICKPLYDRNGASQPLRFQVVTAEGSPAAGALIRKNRYSPVLAVTDAEGRAVIAVPATTKGGDSVRLHVDWQGIETASAIAVGDTFQTPVVQLNPGSGPFTDRYTRIRWDAVDSLLHGQSLSTWQWAMQDDGVPSFLATGPFRTLRAFPPIPDVDNLDRGGVINLHIERTEVLRYLREMVRDTSWHVVSGGAAPRGSVIGLESFIFERVARASDVEAIIARQMDVISRWDDASADTRREHLDALRRRLRFFRTVGHRVPGYYTLSIGVDGCGGGTDVVLRPRQVSLSSVVLAAQTGGSGVRFGTFMVREHVSSEVRTRSADQDALRRAPLHPADLYPPRWLRGGRSIVVPLGVHFEVGDSLPSGAVSTLEEALDTARAGTPVRIRVNDPNGSDSTELTVEEMRRVIGRGLPAIEPVYVYGPSLRVDSVRVAGTTYALRNPDSYATVESPGLGTGSCPFVYTSDDDSAPWLRRGTIIHVARCEGARGYLGDEARASAAPRPHRGRGARDIRGGSRVREGIRCPRASRHTRSTRSAAARS